jgi:6-phosphogluconate dehydrogenase
MKFRDIHRKNIAPRDLVVFEELHNEIKLLKKELDLKKNELSSVLHQSEWLPPEDSFHLVKLFAKVLRDNQDKSNSFIFKFIAQQVGDEIH